MTFVRVPGNDIPEGAEEHWLEGRGGVKVRVLTAPARGAVRGSVIVAPGRTEFIEKYFEVIRELQGRGFAVFCIDWRGQGLSGREVENGLKGHFVTFDDPVNDLSTALRLLSNKLPRPHIGLAHSMGGAILLRALQTRRVELDAAAFSAPMWGIAGLKDLQKKYARFMVSLGLGGTFAPSVETKWKRENFKRNPVTHDKERHARCQGLISEEPRLALAGPTIGWVSAAADAIESFRQPGALANI
ncbi:MAG: alpha/beta hydrolase, partial [Alphaproteobacteria bacterium]